MRCRSSSSQNNGRIVEPEREQKVEPCCNVMETDDVHAAETRGPSHARSDARDGQAALDLVYGTKRPAGTGGYSGADLSGRIFVRGRNLSWMAVDHQRHL